MEEPSEDVVMNEEPEEADEVTQDAENSPSYSASSHRARSRFVPRKSRGKLKLSRSWHDIIRRPKLRFKKDDLVWAKMTGHPPWPGRVCEKKVNQKQEMLLILFFGTRDHAWIPENRLYPYEEYKDVFMRKHNAAKNFFATPKGKKLKAAIDEAEEDLNEEVESEEEVQEDSETSSSDSQEGPLNSSKKSAELSDNLSEISETTVASVLILSESEEEDSLENTSPYSGIDVNWVCRELRGEEQTRKAQVIGIFGSGPLCVQVVKRLMECRRGGKLRVWRGLLGELRTDGVKTYLLYFEENPARIVRESDLIVTCFHDEDALNKSNIMDEEDGIFKEIRRSKTYVEMTPVGVCTSEISSREIHSRGGRYFNIPTFAPSPVEGGRVPVLVSGKYTKCLLTRHCFDLSCFMYPIFVDGDERASLKVNSIYHMLLGSIMAGFAEVLWFAEILKLDRTMLMHILENTTKCSFLIRKGYEMLHASSVLEDSMNLTHSCMRAALEMSCLYKSSAKTVAFVAAETMKCALKTKSDDEPDLDLSELYMRRYSIADLKKRNGLDMSFPFSIRISERDDTPEPPSSTDAASDYEADSPPGNMTDDHSDFSDDDDDAEACLMYRSDQVLETD